MTAEIFIVWEQVLAEECKIHIYESDDMPGNFGFTGCDSDDYTSAEEAILIAMQQNFPERIEDYEF